MGHLQFDRKVYWNYKLTSGIYKPAPRNYKPASRNYKPASRKFEPAPRNYKPAPRKFEPASRKFEPASRNNKPAQGIYRFDMIIGLDDSNINGLKRLVMTQEEVAKILRMTDFCVNIKADHVPDLYYGGDQGFAYIVDLLENACNRLYKSLVK